jgi:hypothetical protein
MRERLQTKTEPSANGKPSVADAAIFDPNAGRSKKSGWRDAIAVAYNGIRFELWNTGLSTNDF